MLANPFYQKIQALSHTRNTSLCIGLDPDLEKIPTHFSRTMSGLQAFLEEMIEGTADLCLCYKPNISFFEGFGLEGLKLLETLRKRIPSEIPMIIDAKRGDIGNTSAMQARYLFDYLGADATTLHPYMGFDSLEPFFRYQDKYHFVLALTSNPGAKDFEMEPMSDGTPLYSHVIKRCLEWNNHFHNIGLVVGATHQELRKARGQSENLLFLIPGVGAQGGDYHFATHAGKNVDNNVLVNVSRGILYAFSEKNFMAQTRALIQTKFTL